MERVILTSRLELILQQTADTGSYDVRDYNMLRSDPGAMLWSFTGASDNLEEAQKALRKHLAISEHDGDIRKYRTSYNVYLRSPTDSGESQSQVRDPSHYLGRVGVKECQEYGPPFSDDLTIPKEVLEVEKILKLEVGYAFLSKAWGKGYATEAMKALVEAFQKPCGFWNPPFERVYLHGVCGGANLRSRRVMEKTGFKLNGIHKWDGPDFFIGGAMQPPEVCVYSLGPSTGIHIDNGTSETTTDTTLEKNHIKV